MKSIAGAIMTVLDTNLQIDDLAPLQNIRVMYVEDEPITRQSIQRIISRKVKEVRVASNGEEGLSLYYEMQPDIVVTDIEMPVMNGIDMVRVIRQKDPEKPVIIITAFRDEAHRCEEADHVIVKPVDKKKLFVSMIEVLQKKNNHS